MKQKYRVSFRIRIGVFYFLTIFWSAQALSLELTPWDPWFYKKLERKELMEQLPKGVHLSSFPFERSILGDSKMTGWQQLKTKFELSVATKLPHIEKRRGAWITPGLNSVIQAESGWVSDHFSVWLEPRIRFSENQETPESFSKMQIQPFMRSIATKQY